MDDTIEGITAMMSQLCLALKRELEDFRRGPDQLAFRECRKQTRRFQLYQEVFKERLCPLLAVWSTRETEKQHVTQHLLSSIQNHLVCLEEYTASPQRPHDAARIFHNVKEKRFSILDKLDQEYASLVSITDHTPDTGDLGVPEMDKAGPDGTLTRAMKSCWTHICNIHRQEPDEQIVANVIFHWGPGTQDSHAFHMQSTTITHHRSYTDHHEVAQSTQTSRSRRSVRFAQDIAATTTARTFTAARTLCKGLEGEEPRVVTSNSAGYVVTTSTKISPSTSEETFVSLESILTERPSRTVHSQRLKIAHAIASSHLRLHPTQWLGDRWSSRDIVFAVKDGLPLLEQPYLRRQSLRGSTGPTEIVRWDDATSTLGILLLELCFNQTIASFARDRQYAQALCALHEEIALAKQWYRELSGRTDDDYDDAVAWCLSTFTQIRDINSEWRQSMQDRVIKPLEKLCNNSVSTSLKVDFDKAAWALRNKFGRLFVVCKKVDDDPSRKGDDDDPIYQALALEKAYCPDDALENLVRQESTLLKDVYTASRLCCLSVKNHVDIRAFRMDKTDIYNEADEFYLGISRQTIYQKICGTFILAMTNPPSETWFKAWDRFTACCRGGQPHLSELITTYFPLDEDVIERLFTGHNPAERKLSPIDPESADVSAFGSSQYYFCAARLVVHKQLHDHSMNDKHSLRMPFTSIKRIGSGSSAAVYRVAIHGGHYDGPDRELAMKVLNVGPKTADEWRHTAWMMDQLQTHECIMRARASLRIHRQVMIFYEAAECDLYSYMTNEEPPSWISRIRMFYTIRDIAHALNYLHSGLSHEAAAMACLHKDMKAENLLVTWRPDKQMRLKLADFGISSIIHERSLPKGDDSNGPSRHMPREHKTRTELSENLHNAAPEMHDNGLVDASADIWAFGTVLADYIAWLFSGRDGLQGFECAKSMGYTDHAYFCVSRSQKEQNDSLPKKNAPGELAQFVLKKEIGDWFESAIHRVRKDKLVAEADVKMLEDCWWLLKSHILVCDARKRANSEDVLRWMGEIYKGTFVRSTNTKNSSKSPKESATQFGQGSVPITTSSTKRERTLSSPTASHKKMRCMHEMMTVES